MSLDQSVMASTANCIPEEPSPSIAPSLTYSSESDDNDTEPIPLPRRRRASTILLAQNAADVQRITGETTTQVLNRCCGGGCCLSSKGPKQGTAYDAALLPDNDAFRSLGLKIEGIPAVLTGVTDMPEQTVYLEKPATAPVSPTDSAIDLSVRRSRAQSTSDKAVYDGINMAETLSKLSLVQDAADLDTSIQPPSFVQPHPPYHVFPSRIHSARELTKPGAEKRTYHFDLDVTNYPVEDAIDFKVGGAIGVMAPNDSGVVEDVLDCLMVPRYQRSLPVVVNTTTGRWPTVWGPEQARCLTTTRRDLLTWCSDIQSYAPTKSLLRVLAEYAADADEKKVLMFLCSAEGQGVFCDFRTGPHISVSQILHAFPSSHPPLDRVLSVLQPLMPRFYSLSNDPHESFQTRDGKQHRLIEIAVTVHETGDWRSGCRTGVGSGFFERQARRYLQEQASGVKDPEIYIPMFKGLMANPLAKEFVSDGPMLLVGAGVGIAPFRGFVQRRLKSANCANKVWVLQGIRDSLVDEIYSGEWGVHENDVKRVIESRRGTGRYVQEEVLNQADLVWYIINSVDGRVFVCGSSKGMGEGVERSLVDVAMSKGNLGRAEAQKFWDLKKEGGQYIAETW